MTANQSSDLAGWTVVCLRPRADQRAAAAAVQARGAVALALPGLRLVGAVDGAQARADLAAALACADVVFTSPAAVRFAGRLLPLPDMRKRMFAVGSGTAAALRARGVEALQPARSAMRSEGLLALPGLADGIGPVGLVTAPGGREVIASTLRERGREVVVAHVYRRLPPILRSEEVDALVASHTPRAVLISSAEAVRYLIEALPIGARGALLASTAIVSSVRLAQVAHDAGFARVITSPSPTVHAMLDTLAEASPSHSHADAECRDKPLPVACSAPFQHRPAVTDTPSTPEFDATPAPASPPPIERRRRGGFGWLVLLVLLALGAAGAWWLWQMQLAASQDASTHWQQARAELDSRLAESEAALAQLERGQKANADRLDAANATNRVLREELLAMGERAALLEDAVARLADQRLRGETVLRLNEAEFLLLLGAERLRLFGDPASAVQAFSLAEASLGSLDDPSLATLRQTLAQEMIELRSVPPDPRPQLRGELAALANALATLPASRSGEIVATDARDSRLARILSQLVTVRRVAERDAVLGPVQRDAALAAVRLQIELAQTALARPDPEAYRDALDQVAAASERLFDRNDTAAANYFATLDRVRNAELVPTMPALGATLQELRGLRATRSVGRDVAPAALPGSDAPAASPTPSTPTDAASPTPAPQSEPAAPPAIPLPELERTTPTDDGDGTGDVE